MLISKSLFVDYCDFPKLAWWKHNNLEVYKKIRGLDDEDSAEHLIELGQEVEDLVGEYFLKKEGISRYDVFEDNDAKNPLDEEDEDIYLVQETYAGERQRNIEKTLEAIKRKESLIYQPGFLVDELYVRVDYLRLNSSGSYDIIEVKAKTHVRKEKKHEGVKNKNSGNLETKFLADMSFQKYVVNKVLKIEGFPELGKYYFAYLNRDYKKQGAIDVKKLILLDEVDIQKTIILEGEETQKEFQREDYPLSVGIIEEKLKQIRKELLLSEKDFNNIHHFSGSKFVEYFGRDREFGTIYGKGLTSPKAVKTLHYEENIQLENLDPEQRTLFNKADGTQGSARQYIENYLEVLKTGKDIIDTQEIENCLSELTYPLCFYDYETVSVPTPLFDGTGAYQQVVVQYSLHKVYESGKIEHFGGILESISDTKEVRILEISDNENAVSFEQEKVISGNYKHLIEEFLEDIGNDISNSSFIVWYKTFENTRNKEIIETFPQFAESFQNIIENTFDLMDISKKGFYYSHTFQGSNSIKFVLPALTDMSYDNMNIPNGLEAMKILKDMLIGNIEASKREGTLKDLLLYCGQDSLAMYRIFQEFQKTI